MALEIPADLAEKAAIMQEFRRRRDADAYATSVEADRLRGIAIDPRRARVTLGTYGRENLEQRKTGLALRTVDQYEWLFEQLLWRGCVT